MATDPFENSRSSKLVAGWRQSRLASVSLIAASVKEVPFIRTNSPQNDHFQLSGSFHKESAFLETQRILVGKVSASKSSCDSIGWSDRLSWLLEVELHDVRIFYGVVVIISKNRDRLETKVPEKQLRREIGFSDFE